MWASSRKQAEPLRRRVAARAFEDAAAVVDDVRGDVDRRVLPLHQLAVHPDLARARKRHHAAPYKILAFGDSRLANWRSHGLNRLRVRRGLLRFAAERAAIRAGVQRLAAVPAEARLRRFARLQAGLDVLRDVVGRGVAGGVGRGAASAAARCLAPPARRRAARRRAGSGRGSRAPSPSGRCR